MKIHLRGKYDNCVIETETGYEGVDTNGEKWVSADPIKVSGEWRERWVRNEPAVRAGVVYAIVVKRERSA